MRIVYLNALLAFALLSPSLSQAQAPNLGTAADYVLFSSTGAVGNTGVSHLTGNIGTNSGAITIYVNVNGVIHNTDGATAQAAIDVQKAYYQIDTTSYTSIHSPLLGNNDTLTPGVYLIAGSTTLDSFLTLDAQSNPNAVFIFKMIGGTFATTTSARVKLIGGAQACNVFWKSDGAVSLVPGSEMKGTIIARSSAIDIGAGAVLEGRALTSISGAITTNQVLAYTPTGCNRPMLTGPAAPALGTTACYALFSGNGSVSNTDSTVVSGDVGTNVGLTTGFDSSNVSGSIHPGPDASTANCKSDLLNVHTYLNNLNPDITLQYPAQFGQSLVLTPHTYLLNAATHLTDTLFLNAEGNVNAVFVLKIAGALSTSAHSQVVLTNGTQATNVYWNVEGAVSIVDSSVFKGTIICNNGAIDLTHGVNLDGRALTTVGALSTAAITTTMAPGPCGNVTALPLAWRYFQAHPTGGQVRLEWGTAQEAYNDFFSIEKSGDGSQFETIGRVNAQTGMDGKADYSFTDLNALPRGYYRISQTDFNGLRSYSNTILVSRNAVSGTYQSTDGNQILVHTSGLESGAATLRLISTEGRTVSSQQLLLNREPGLYRLDKPWQKGLYLLIIESQGSIIYSSRVLVD